LRSYRKSLELFERARHALAGGVSSQFRASEQPYPLFYARAEGTRVWDEDGNESLDFTLSQGPLILGHSNPTVLSAVATALSVGQLYAGQHLAELELAEALKRVIPCAELVRFCVSGSEAVQAALRLARAHTKKPAIIKFEGHYHGWLDSVAFNVNSPARPSSPDFEECEPIPWTTGMAPGLEKHLIILPWNDLDAVRKAFQKRGGEIAAIITEPIMCNNGCILPKPGFLEGLRELCDQYGAVLIFDEIITGFRVSLGGAQAYFKVSPDLAIFGKAMGSGFPISAIVGRQRIMKLLETGETIVAGTMNAQNASIAAALATVAQLEAGPEDTYARLYELAQLLRGALKEAATLYGHQILIQGLGPVFHVGFTLVSEVSDYNLTHSYDKIKYAQFCLNMREKGIRLIPRGLWYLSTAHTVEDVARCAQAARASFEEMEFASKSQ
jgi:glutamate-1-semialdehyde 2,1-aminomutase